MEVIDGSKVRVEWWDSSSTTTTKAERIEQSESALTYSDEAWDS